jgi:hypothetical protein
MRGATTTGGWTWTGADELWCRVLSTRDVQACGCEILAIT